MPNNPRLDRRLSRLYPGLFIILLDQSGSMGPVESGKNYKFADPFDPNTFNSLNPQSHTKADIVTAAINTIIFEMAQEVGIDAYAKVRKKSAYISVIGYNDRVYPLVSKSTHPHSAMTSDSFDPIDIPTLFLNPLGKVDVKRPIRTPEGIKYRVETRPYWIEPLASGMTKMPLALEQARIVAHNWLNSKPEYIPELELEQHPRKECFPPVIINITDARSNGDGNPIDVAKQIQQVGTGNSDGDLLIFNCHFTSEKGRAITFPANVKEMQYLNAEELPLATMMFEMSSHVPDVLCSDAKRIARKPISSETRCYVYNADPNVLIAFLRWGTRRQLEADLQDIL